MCKLEPYVPYGLVFKRDLNSMRVSLSKSAKLYLSNEKYPIESEDKLFKFGSNSKRESFLKSLLFKVFNEV